MGWVAGLKMVEKKRAVCVGGLEKKKDCLIFQGWRAKQSSVSELGLIIVINSGRFLFLLVACRAWLLFLLLPALFLFMY